jgi:hypothetical protein
MQQQQFIEDTNSRHCIAVVGSLIRAIGFALLGGVASVAAFSLGIIEHGCRYDRRDRGRTGK